jgi:Tfp pilus assembly protein PilF
MSEAGMIMMGSRPFRLGAWVMALGGACVAGCQHPRGSEPPPAIPAILKPAGGSEHTTLKPQQRADIKIALGRSMEQRGEETQAMGQYSEALTNDPTRWDAWLRLAVLHDRQGKFAESEAEYRKALALKPGDPDIYCNVGYSFYLQQRWVESEMNLRQAIALRSDHARAHNNLGMVLAQTSRVNEAMLEFRKGDCTGGDAHANLAFALTLAGNWSEARDHYRKALASSPPCESARAGLAKLEAVLAKAPPAIRAPPEPLAISGNGPKTVPVQYRPGESPTSPAGNR